jgi:hypothetical protein
MRAILFIRTRSEDRFAERIQAEQARTPEHKLETVDLTGPEPDYGKLLEKIFEADSVQVW